VQPPPCVEPGAAEALEFNDADGTATTMTRPVTIIGENSETLAKTRSSLRKPITKAPARSFPGSAARSLWVGVNFTNQFRSKEIIPMKRFALEMRPES
jgi:hypothetical protein